MVTPNQIINADNVETLRTFPDECIDSIVTDPPYGLSFMGKRWDYDVPSVELWQECLRVLKPGGHLLAFAGTRTQHRMAVRIEDAGFEIRDMIAWVYGSGFPKSLDVSKAIDKQRDDREQTLQVTGWIRQQRDAAGIGNADIDGAFGFHGMAGHWTSQASQPAVPTLEQVPKLLEVLGVTLDDVPEEIRNLIWTLNGNKGQPGAAWLQREVIGQSTSAISTRKDLCNDKGTVWGTNSSTFNITAPATESAKQWQGWGTALKPALEPITVARKPLCGTVAENVLQHGTGAMNVDGCRVTPTGEKLGGSHVSSKAGGWDRPWKHDFKHLSKKHAEWEEADRKATELGRWPANLIHDGSEEVTRLFPDDGDASAARFFYCAKADGTERRNSRHPTVKPVALMRYLVRLVTPAGGIVLDPFGGSGSTAEAARLESCRFILIEREAEYCRYAAERLRQGVLF